MVAIFCRYGGKIDINGSTVRYVGGRTVISHTSNSLNLHELKQLVRGACGFDRDISFEMEWNMKDSLASINTEEALKGIFECCGTKLEIYVSTTIASSSVPSRMEPSADIVMPENASSDESDKRNDSSEDSLLAPTTAEDFSSCSDDDPAVDRTKANGSNSSVPKRLKQIPSEFISGDWEQGFESRDWDLTQLQRSTGEKQLQRGEQFKDKEALQHAVKLWHIASSRECGTFKSNKDTIYFKCTNVDGGDCSWSLRGRETKLGIWEITKVGPPHSCVNTTVIQKHKQLDSKVIVDLIFPYVFNNTGMKVCDLQQVVRDKFAQFVSYRKVWYSKQKVIEKVWGTHEGAFQRLPSLMATIAAENPGSVYEFEWKGQPNEMGAVFGKMYWAFAPSIEGFAYCRPLISIDATHLYGKYSGKLLIVVAFDADNQIFPLCYAFADSESTDSWTWFLERLRRFVTRDQRKICIISDRHAGIKAAIANVFSSEIGVHRYCARHLASNFNTHFKDREQKKNFSQMAFTTSRKLFDKAYAGMLEVNNGAFKNWLESCGDFSMWALSYDEGYRYGQMTTNHSEVFNKVLKGARAMPVTYIVQAIFERLNNYFVTRRQHYLQELSEGHMFMPKIREKVLSTEEESREFDAITYKYGQIFKVMKRGSNGGILGQVYKVNIVDHTCKCGEWTLFHRPCAHAIAALRLANTHWLSYVDPHYNLEAYQKTYEKLFHPLPDEEEWTGWTGPSVRCDPRMMISKRGRRKGRIHNEMDQRDNSKSKRCSKCGVRGHNRRSCKS